MLDERQSIGLAGSRPDQAQGEVERDLAAEQTGGLADGAQKVAISSCATGDIASR